jgi:hypothetical protein
LPHIVKYGYGITGRAHLFYLPCIVQYIQVAQVINGEISYLLASQFIKYKGGIGSLSTGNFAAIQ